MTRRSSSCRKRSTYVRFLGLVFTSYTRRASAPPDDHPVFLTTPFLHLRARADAFYGVSATVPLYGLAFSIGNLIGPLARACSTRSGADHDLRDA
jgi:hypothetical protein